MALNSLCRNTTEVAIVFTAARCILSSPPLAFLSPIPEAASPCTLTVEEASLESVGMSQGRESSWAGLSSEETAQRAMGVSLLDGEGLARWQGWRGGAAARGRLKGSERKRWGGIRCSGQRREGEVCPRRLGGLQAFDCAFGFQAAFEALPRAPAAVAAAARALGVSQAGNAPSRPGGEAGSFCALGSEARGGDGGEVGRLRARAFPRSVTQAFARRAKQTWRAALETRQRGRGAEEAGILLRLLCKAVRGGGGGGAACQCSPRPFPSCDDWGTVRGGGPTMRGGW